MKMENFEINSLADGYKEIIDTVLKNGEEVSPRGQLTRELTNVTIKLNDPSDVLLDGTNRRNYRPEIGVAEALQLVGGFSDTALLERITKTFARFKDGSALHGAYGPRVQSQIPRIIRRLKNDHDTRQAVVTIWDPMYDGDDEFTPKDLPCTVYLSFRIRHDKLIMETHMRSNDAWLGFSYDAIQFTTLQQTVASILQVDVGPYIHYADSFHLYERNFEDAEQVTYPEDNARRLHLYGIAADDWSEAQEVSHDVVYTDVALDEFTPTELWFNEKMKPYRS
jgi:thymidylate synthase